MKNKVRLKFFEVYSDKVTLGDGGWMTGDGINADL